MKEMALSSITVETEDPNAFARSWALIELAFNGNGFVNLWDVFHLRHNDAWLDCFRQIRLQLVVLWPGRRLQLFKFFRFLVHPTSGHLSKSSANKGLTITGSSELFGEYRRFDNIPFRPEY